MKFNALFGKNIFEKVENKENQSSQDLKCIHWKFCIIYRVSYEEEAHIYWLLVLQI